MGPKKGKDVFDENYWRTFIENAPLDDEIWKVKVILIEAAGSDQDRIYLTNFEVFAAEEKRFVIKNICKTETIFMVNQLGGEKKIKDDNLRVFEEGQNYLKEKKDIPPDVLALIIKHLILKMKDEYLFIKRQKLQVREGMRKESATMIDRAEVRGTVNVKSPEPPEPPELPKAKGKKGETEPADIVPELDEGKKYNTLLRERGEEWRDKVYIDDFPKDGPNIYVVVTGFQEPYLAGYLIKFGIPLVAVVQIRIDITNTQLPSDLVRACKRGQSQTDTLTEKSFKFWEDLQQLRIQQDSADIYKNTAFIVFSPPYWDTEPLSGNPEKIYDELCYLMYDIQDLTRQHLHFLENMNIINVPQEVEENLYKEYYYLQIDDLPLECVTIYSVLDSILETVTKSHKFEQSGSKSSMSTPYVLNQTSPNNQDKMEKAQVLVNKIFNTLCKLNNNKKSYRITYGEEYENHKNPVVINYGDNAKYPTFHLGNINLDNIVRTTLHGMPINRLWDNQVLPSDELEAKINFHVNVLLSCFDRKDVETSELNRLMHILACRKLYNNRSSLQITHLPPSTIAQFKKKFLKRSALAEPLTKSLFQNSGSKTHSITKSENAVDEFYGNNTETSQIKILFDCPDISELVSVAEIDNNKPMSHLIDNYEVFEDFSRVCSFQVLLDAFNNFNCIDYKYCTVTDCIIMMFFNSQDNDGLAREDWRCHLPTPLCLQDFFDFVLEEHLEWIQNEEKVYDQNMYVKDQSNRKDDVDLLATKSCIDHTDVEMELLMEGSLKYELIEQMEDISDDETDQMLSASKKTTISPSATELDSKSGKKTKSPLASTPKRKVQSFVMSSSSHETVLPKKPFSGYNLGDRRIEVFGKDSIFFSKEGTRVSTMYTLMIPMNLEYVILNVVPGNNNNSIWVHRVLGENVSSKVLDMCASFRITTKDQVSINLKKETYQIPLPVTMISSIENPNREERLTKTRSEFLTISETRNFYSFCITWPNGLITESVHVGNSPDISHVKQHYVTHLPHINEDMRCISLNGEVIIFRPAGYIEIYKPDGSYFKIIKCEKRQINNEPKDVISEASSDKSKKGKGKEKEKSLTKSSKYGITEENSKEKLPEYELVIDEFDVTETSGLRQKYVNENVCNIEKLLIKTATDYCLGEIFSRRIDGVKILLNKDGMQVVTFSDETRIITNYVIEDEEVFPEWTDEEKEYFDTLESDNFDTDTIKSENSQKTYIDTESISEQGSMFGEAKDEEPLKQERTDGYISVNVIYTIEHSNFTTVTINKSTGKISINSPNQTSIIIDDRNNYDLILDSVTTAHFDGENLHLDYEGCTKCGSKTTCDIKITPDDTCSVTKIHQNLVKMKDSFCKEVVVNEEGTINIIESEGSTELLQDYYQTTEPLFETATSASDKLIDKSEDLVMHDKCNASHQAKSLKFFVLRRDLTCSELVHRSLVEQYMSTCCWQPWCSIDCYDTFGDNRSLLSILSPIHLTETEKWLMDSKLANKPKYLAYKDLKKDEGKGFYHWMRPYKRFEPKPMKPANVLPPRLPKAFVLRTLEQQWSESKREHLQGAKELLTAILRYRHIMMTDAETMLNVPILDPRPKDERKIDDIIQALSHRIYEGLRERLADDVQMRAKTNITTKPPLVEELSVEGEMEYEATQSLKTVEEDNETLLKEVDQAEEMSPNLRKYWRRRTEEYNEEQFYLYLLRQNNVPPYFKNVLGGAIWWEMNAVAGDAMNKSERRKMKCICKEDAEQSEGTAELVLPPANLKIIKD